MADRITYVGLDVHKETIVVAVAEGGLRGEVREYGRIANTPTALDRLLRKAWRRQGRCGTVKLAVSRVGPVGGRGDDASRAPIYTGHRYPAQIISYALWLYFRFPLSLRMVEEMLAAHLTL